MTEGYERIQIAVDRVKDAYGQIICDPNSEEAKALLGKKVVASDYYKAIEDRDERFIQHGVLTAIKEDKVGPFVIDDNPCFGRIFIRGAIEEELKYRPYADSAEMVEDFNARFMNTPLAPCFMPLVWVKLRDGKDTAYLVSGYDDGFGLQVLVSGCWIGANDLLERYTYLDGSPCGKDA